MPTRKSIQISEAESIVMRVIWGHESILTEDVIAALATHGRWQESTVKTLLNRLLKKGAVKARKDNRRYLYSAVLTREEWLADESHGFLDRVFGGRVAPLVSYFSERKKLSKKDIDELKKLIKEFDDER